MTPRSPRLAAALLVALCGVERGSAVVLSSPEQFHVAVTGSAGELVVTYVTGADDAADPSCEVKGLGCFQGSSRTYTDGDWQGKIHAVKLRGLQPATRYDYVCSGTSRQLRTPPWVAAGAAPTWPLRVAAVADLGEGCSTPGCGNATIAALASKARAEAYDLLVHAGDIAYTSGDQNIWDEYMREMDPTVSRVPYMVTPGNHEHYYNFSGYRHRFDMPGPHDGDVNNYRRNLWGSFDVAGVHFVYISTEHLSKKNNFADEQIAWLREDLTKAKARRSSVPWIVAYGHKPLYCSTEDFYDCSEKMGMGHIRKLFEPLFEEFGVDLYLTGHLHNYERTWPVCNGVVEQKSYTGVKDTVHVVIGSAGDNEGLTDRWESAVPSWSVVREGENVGFAEMEFANESTLSFTYRNAATGSVIDSFVLTKSRAVEEVVV